MLSSCIQLQQHLVSLTRTLSKNGICGWYAQILEGNSSKLNDARVYNTLIMGEGLVMGGGNGGSGEEGARRNEGLREGEGGREGRRKGPRMEGGREGGREEEGGGLTRGRNGGSWKGWMEGGTTN